MKNEKETFGFFWLLLLFVATLNGSPTFLKTIGPWHIGILPQQHNEVSNAFELHALLRVAPRICASKGWNDMKRPSGKK